MGLTKANFYKPEEPKLEVRKPEFKIVTSWDDGGDLDMRVAELLKKYNLPGTFYIVTDWIGLPARLTWDNIRDLLNQGFEIGSHTLSHPADLKLCYDEDLFKEVQTSKDILESALGVTIKSFCYPRGRADTRVKDAVMKAGYLEARGTGKPGVTSSDDLFYLPGTIHIYPREEYGAQTILEFAERVIDRVVTEGGYCNIWGHSKEIDENNLWSVLEGVLDHANQMIRAVS